MNFGTDSWVGAARTSLTFLEPLQLLSKTEKDLEAPFKPLSQISGLLSGSAIEDASTKKSGLASTGQASARSKTSSPGFRHTASLCNNIVQQRQFYLRCKSKIVGQAEP
mmetsp:Transcript_24993/g.67958  ORF Transcript_24993/g.67958 Transcript_24993/m.67958 type:complete len:109 (-) Transcript_24993:165-491(-)